MMDLNRKGQLQACAFAENFRQPVTGVGSFSDSLIRYQQSVCSEELGDWIDVGPEALKKAREESGVTLGAEDELAVADDLRNCLYMRALEYCAPSTCRDRDAVEVRIRKALTQISTLST